MTGERPREMHDDQQRAIRLVSLAYARTNGAALGALMRACQRFVHITDLNVMDMTGMDDPRLEVPAMQEVERAALDVGVAIDALREMAGMRKVLLDLTGDTESFGGRKL